MKSYPNPYLSHLPASSMLIPSLKPSNYTNTIPKLSSPDSLLGPRVFQPHMSEYAIYEDVKKRIKTSNNYSYNEPQAFPQSSTEMAFRGMKQNFYESSKFPFETNTRAIFHQNNQALQQAQYLELLMSMKEKMQPIQNFEKLTPNFMLPHGFSQSTKMNPLINFQETNLGVKVEDESKVHQDQPFKVKKEAGKKSPSQTSTKPELTQNECSSPMICEAPALTEFTKHFDDWDLCSIFEFLRSGKTKEEFTIEKKGKLSKKFRAKRRRTTVPKSKKQAKDVKLESFEM
jgi:hypothetical protein